MSFQLLQTPIGTLRLVAANAQLLRIEFENQYRDDEHTENRQPGDGDEVLAACADQLTDYFAGHQREFNLPLATQGTDFQVSVWSALRGIPYGETCSYRDIAETIGNPAAVRAVGAANGRNPLPIVVPCHRVVASNGKLTGFAGGLEAKSFLLRLESGEGS